VTLARVVGTVVTSTVDDRVSRPKYLLVEPADQHGAVPSDGGVADGAGDEGHAGGGSAGAGKGPAKAPVAGTQIVALDVVGAGPGELVVLAQGSSARQTPETDKTAIDAVIAGIVDTVTLSGETTYRK
jgi:microcompartment protein CcmK/EutM